MLGESPVFLRELSLGQVEGVRAFIQWIKGVYFVLCGQIRSRAGHQVIHC